MTRGVGLREALEAQAAALGFDRLAVAPARPLERWRREAGENPHWAGLTWNPRQLLPGAERVVLLLKGYRPYAPRPGLVSLSAYYPCSQWAYQHSPALARTLEAAGFQALCHPALPYKPCLALAGTAAYGRNGLTALAPWGSRFAVQAVLTDAPLPLDPPQPPAAQPSVAARPMSAVTDFIGASIRLSVTVRPSRRAVSSSRAMSRWCSIEKSP